MQVDTTQTRQNHPHQTPTANIAPSPQQAQLELEDMPDWHCQDKYALWACFIQYIVPAEPSARPTPFLQGVSKSCTLVLKPLHCCPHVHNSSRALLLARCRCQPTSIAQLFATAGPRIHTPATDTSKNKETECRSPCQLRHAETAQYFTKAPC